MLQEDLDTSYYKTGESLLDDLLKDKKVKHHRHLRYLAPKREGSILKLRFVLNPFAFAFLLAGKEQYHFTRLIHDYRDERKGFVVWKDRLEERLL